MFHITGLVLLVAIVVSTFALGSYYGNPFSGDAEEEVVMQSEPIDWSSWHVLTGTDRVKVSLYNEIAISHQDDGEIRCENSTGVVTLVAQLQGNDPHMNGGWMTSRGDFRGDGSIDPAEKLFSSPMWTQTPNLATTTHCIGLGYNK